jgi:Gpi18-like mannosyltransferase
MLFLRSMDTSIIFDDVDEFVAMVWTSCTRNRSPSVVWAPYVGFTYLNTASIC